MEPEMLLDQLKQDKNRPRIQYKNNKYYCRYRNHKKGVDRDRNFQTREEAEKWRKMMIDKFGIIQSKGPNLMGGLIRATERKISALSPLKEYINYWLEYIDTIPRKPARSTISSLKHSLGYDLVNTPVEDINYKHLAQYMKQRSLSANKPSPSTLNIDLSSINRVIKEVNTIFEVTPDNDHLDKASRLLRKHGFISASGVKERRLESGDWKKLLKGLNMTKKDKSLRRKYTLMFRLYISTALRCSELLSLTWKSINFDASTLSVVILKQKGKHRGKLQTISMLDKTKRLFLMLRPDNYRLEDRIFHVTPSSMSSAFTKAAFSARLEGLTLHDLRTEGISRMLECGFSVPIVATFTGHKDLKTITNVYARLESQNILRKLQ
tara:strand:- start:469 stop:1608 length:1140 start_codon:yes stop_codon:yes gene_type:complete